jgi:hypothetical protein
MGNEATQRYRRRWALTAMLLGILGSRVGNGTSCPEPDPCLHAGTTTAPDGKAWRGRLSLSLESIFVSGSPVSFAKGSCERLPNDFTFIDGTIPLVFEESSTDETGALHVVFEADTEPLTWPNGRPQFRVGQPDPETYIARAADVVVTPDRQLTATLALVRVRADFSDGGGLEQEELGTFRIEGPVSVECPEGDEFHEVAVPDGTARIRCGVVPEPQTGCGEPSSGCAF